MTVLNPLQLGAQSQTKGKGKFTLYCLAEVDAKPATSGGISVRTPTGETRHFQLSKADIKNANMQGTAVIRDADGEAMIINFIRIGDWYALPPGWHGKGNRDNPIHPFLTVAADQKLHPYGSRIFIPDAKGFKTPEGTVLDGFFWVADVGPRIKGQFRFDIFIGDASNYTKLREKGIAKWDGNVEVENLPSPLGGLDYRNQLGRRRILEKLGYDVEGPIERLLEELGDVEDAGTTLDAALVHFQKQHPSIPRLEYKRGDDAVTRWFLAQAAVAISKGQPYSAARPPQQDSD